MAVKIILRQNVPNLGQAGEVKQVAPGYFRNYLLPRGLAVQASEVRLNSLNADTTADGKRLEKGKAKSGELAHQLSEVTLRIPVRMGEQGRIHGSVTNKDLAEALAQQAGARVDRHKIELREPLKSIGIHSVP